MGKGNDYPYIRKWGKMMGSDQSYIEREVQRARETNAPANATFERTGPGGVDTGEWATIDECRNPHAFQQMGLPVPDHLKYGAAISVGKTFSDPKERDAFANAVVEALDAIGVPQSAIRYIPSNFN